MEHKTLLQRYVDLRKTNRILFILTLVVTVGTILIVLAAISLIVFLIYKKKRTSEDQPSEVLYEDPLSEADIPEESSQNIKARSINALREFVRQALGDDLNVHTHAKSARDMLNKLKRIYTDDFSSLEALVVQAEERAFSTEARREINYGIKYALQSRSLEYWNVSNIKNLLDNAKGFLDQAVVLVPDIDTSRLETLIRYATEEYNIVHNIHLRMRKTVNFPHDISRIKRLIRESSDVFKRQRLKTKLANIKRKRRQINDLNFRDRQQFITLRRRRI